MTDIETPSTDRTETDRAETVTRVISAISSGTSGGALDRVALRDALASEGQSLLDLPEVGLWLALTEISLTESVGVDEFGTESVGVDEFETESVGVDDLGALPEPDPEGRVELDEGVAPGDPTVIDLRDTAPEAGNPPPPNFPDPVNLLGPPPTSAPSGPPRRRGRRRARRPGPAPVAFVPAPEPLQSVEPETPPEPTPDPVASAIDAWASSSVAAEVDDLLAHVHAVLVDAVSFTLPDPAAVGAATIDWDHAKLTALHRVSGLEPHLRTALAPAMPVDLPDPSAPGSSSPEAYWPPSVVRSIRQLTEHLTSALIRPLDLRVAATTEPRGATLDAYWRPHDVKRIDAMHTFLRSLFALPTRGRAPASRLAGASNGAIPDPYWPRHLIRPGASATSTNAVVEPPTGPPRSAEQLESDLLAVLDGVALVGEADLDPFAAEMEISLAQLLRRVPLDRLGRVYPATLAAFLVRQTMLHPSPTEFDERIPLRMLRRTNPVGLAFSEALVRLGKPVFREVEHRDHFDRRLRYARRMQLHAGIPADAVDVVVDAVDDAHWSGASTGREVAQDWLLAPTATVAAIGEPSFRLLTRTDHGAEMLEALLALVRSHRFDEEDAKHRPDDLSPLPTALVDRAWARLGVTDAPDREWGEAIRPTLRLGLTAGSGPVLSLPRSSARWHLNGELLTYGSPTHEKPVELPPSRAGRWIVTAGSKRSGSPLDVRVTSAADDRTVLVFDERGRYHDRALPLGGSTATVIAPSGSRVAGDVERTLLVGRWVGFEEISVDLTSLDELEVTERGRDTVAVTVDHRLDLDVLRAGGTVVPGPIVVARGHVPPLGDVHLTVSDDGRPREARLGDPRVLSVHGGFRLNHLVEREDAHDLTLTFSRPGVSSIVRTVHLEAQRRPRLPVPEPRRVEPDARVRASVASFTAEPHALSHTDLELLWVDDPYAAALADVWSGPGDPSAVAERWERHAGWAPPAEDDDAGPALSALFDPMAHAVLGTGTDGHRPADAPILSSTFWRTALSEDAGVLEEWANRHRRPVTQWRVTQAALANTAPVWDRLGGATSGPAAATLVAAALLTFLPGPRQLDAADRLGEALLSAPASATAAAVLAIAFTRVQRSHPQSRFTAVELPRPTS